jgi:hypothetical protein
MKIVVENSQHIDSMFTAISWHVTMNLKKKNRGPKTEPWDTPTNTSSFDDNTHLHITLCDLELRLM